MNCYCIASIRLAAALAVASFAIATCPTASAFVVDSFDTPEQHLGTRRTNLDSVGSGTVITNSLIIAGDGTARIDLAATSSPTSNTFRYLSAHIFYDLYPSPINIAEEARLTLRGSGFGSAFGSSEIPSAGSSMVAIWADIGGGWVKGQSLVSASSAIGDISFDIAGGTSINNLHFIFTIDSRGGDASLHYDLDEISISPVPAPSAAPLLALAALSARGRRRK